MRTFNPINRSSFSSASDMLSSRNSRCSAGADRMSTESPAALNVSALAEHRNYPLEGMSQTRLYANCNITHLEERVGSLEQELEDANHALEIETSVTRLQKDTIAKLNSRNSELEEKLTRAEASAAIWKREV
ncbi:hypothetical protein EV177_010176, partial [Coemansia sp. RSA 1804]